MNQRGRTQLRIQQTVEGLSVVAISYYLVGLIERSWSGLHELGMDISKDVFIALSVPICIIAVLIFTRIVMRHLLKDSQENSSS